MRLWGDIQTTHHNSWALRSGVPDSSSQPSRHPASLNHTAQHSRGPRLALALFQMLMILHHEMKSLPSWNTHTQNVIIPEFQREAPRYKVTVSGHLYWSYLNEDFMGTCLKQASCTGTQMIGETRLLRPRSRPLSFWIQILFLLSSSVMLGKTLDFSVSLF